MRAGFVSPLIFAVAYLAASPLAAQSTDNPVADLTLLYDGASVSNVHGGLTRSSAYIGNLHLRGLFDLERAWGWTDTRVFADALWIHGGQPDNAIGDVMGVNNLTGPSGVQPEELWIERNFRRGSLSTLVGLYDVNTEFYRLQSSGLFLNSALGIGEEFAQSGVEGPSTFPRTSVGLRMAYKPAPDIVLRATVLDGVPLIREGGRYGLFESGDGLLYTAELAMLDRPGSKMSRNKRMRIGRNAMLPPYQGKLALGAWHYTGSFERIDTMAQPRMRHGSSGGYVLADRVVASAASNPDRALSLFGEWGFAESEVNRFSQFIAAGAVVVGPFAGRQADEAGIAVAISRNGSPYLRQQQALAAPVARAETAIELTYLARVSSWLVVQPDLQYVIHPNTQPDTSNALVFSLRFEISRGYSAPVGGQR